MVVPEMEIHPEKIYVASLLNGDHLSLQTTVHFYSYMYYQHLRTRTEYSLNDRQPPHTPPIDVSMRDFA